MQNSIKIFDDLKQVLEQLKPNVLFDMETPIGKVCLVKTGETLSFFKDACPHLGVPFTQSGVCNAFGEVVCKEHGHRYSLLTGSECDGRREALEFIPYKVIENKLYFVIE